MILSLLTVNSCKRAELQAVLPPLLLLLLLQFTMREVQGGIIGSGLIVMAIGLTGIIRPVLRAISPITVAANIGVLVCDTGVLALAVHVV
jgi:hypothetical protein